MLFRSLELVDQYDVTANVFGGGHSAQAEAMRHGIARALCEIDAERRPSLKMMVMGERTSWQPIAR